MADYLNRASLKVDATAVQMESRNVERKYLLIYNCNLPEETVRDDDQMRGALTRIGHLIQTDFRSCEHVSFQVTASYWLRNPVSSEEKLWVGSFFGRNNALAQLSRFTVFEPDTFVDTAFESTRNIDNKLKFFGMDTVWVFHKLESVVINFQSQAFEKNPILTKRNLLLANKRNKRNHELFQLP